MALEIRRIEGQHSELAKAIAVMASDRAMTLSDVRKLVCSRLGEVNFYPGLPTDQCHRLAFFISLQGKLANGRGHCSFDTMLQKFIQHMQGPCSMFTERAVFITDSWRATIFEPWTDIAAIICRGAWVEIYLIGQGGWSAQIPL